MDIERLGKLLILGQCDELEPTAVVEEQGVADVELPGNPSRPIDR